MFLGSYKPSFDLNSRRIALPKKIREYLKTNEIILSFGFEKCIFGFDTQTWQEQSEKQLGRPITDWVSRDIRRFFFATAEHIRLDDQGRFVIPGQLLEYADVKSPIIIGAGDHLEIWDEETWEAHKLKLGGEA